MASFQPGGTVTSSTQTVVTGPNRTAPPTVQQATGGSSGQRDVPKSSSRVLPLPAVALRSFDVRDPGTSRGTGAGTEAGRGKRLLVLERIELLEPPTPEHRVVGAVPQPCGQLS